MAVLVDKSTPTVAALSNATPCGERGKWRGSGRTLLFDIACGLARRVPLTKLVELYGDIRPYLHALIVATLAWVSETLVVPEGIRVMIMTRDAFKNILLKEASHKYDNYRLVSR